MHLLDIQNLTSGEVIAKAVVDWRKMQSKSVPNAKMTEPNLDPHDVIVTSMCMTYKADRAYLSWIDCATGSRHEGVVSIDIQ